MRPHVLTQDFADASCLCHTVCAHPQIVYECVRTVTTIYPDPSLLDLAAAGISRFLSSDNHNLKYVGVTGLAAIVKVRHQFYYALRASGSGTRTDWQWHSASSGCAGQQ
jgi:hypothetical protein